MYVFLSVPSGYMTVVVAMLLFTVGNTLTVVTIVTELDDNLKSIFFYRAERVYAESLKIIEEKKNQEKIGISNP